MKKYTIDDLRDIMVQLRGENGCPWDKVQTHQSIKKILWIILQQSRLRRFTVENVRSGQILTEIY